MLSRLLFCGLLVSTITISCSQPAGIGSSGQGNNVRVVRSESAPAVVLQTGTGREFHVAPGGKPRGDGKKDHPLDLATAVSSQSPAKPGDTIWLHGGTYTGAFRASLSGKPNQPIKVRGYPGQRVVIDFPWAGDDDISHSPVWLDGDYVELYDVEVTNSNTSRSQYRPTGISMTGKGTKVINCYVHDCGNGIFPSDSTQGAEIYGNILMNNGWQDTANPNGAGHGLYGQNHLNTLVIKDNLILNNYNLGFQFYSGSNPVLVGLDFTGNVVFNNGAPVGQIHDAVVIGGVHVPADRINVSNNYFARGKLILGYTYPSNGVASCTGNIFGAVSGLEAFGWSVGGLTVSNNKFIVMTHGTIVIRTSEKGRGWKWDNNSYYAGRPNLSPFDISGTGGQSSSGWQAQTGYDQHSSFTSTVPPTDIVLRSNAYNSNRWDVIVYNLAGAPSVSMDLSSVLANGDSYSLINAQDYTGKLIFNGTYNGSSLTVPMTGLSVAPPIGAGTGFAPPGPLFNVFVLIKR